MELERHYQTEQWADYARGLVALEERSAMDDHLSQGCPKCGRQAEVLGHMARIGLAEARYQPPPELTQRALDVFRPREAAPTLVSRIVAHLVYDSLLDPLPAGVRAQDRPRQALYEAEGFSVDVHVNRERLHHGGPQLVIVGQVIDSHNPHRRLSRRPVMLRSGTRLKACGMSNELGEFHLVCAPADDLTLEIPVDDTRVVEATLPSPAQAGV